jgi:glycosyltransferase involved in cell wall biosynthesis
MHVLIIPSWYPRFPGDPEGSFFRDQAHALAASGLKVGVLFPDLKGPKRYFGKERPKGITISQDGPISEVRSHGFNWFPGQMRAFEWLWTGHAKRAMKSYMRHFGKPDIIHAHSMLPAAVVADKLRALYGIPFVTTEHSTFLFQGNITTSIRRKCTYLANESSANIAVSRICADELEERFGGSWQDVPNVVAARFLSHSLISRSRGELHLVSVAFLRRHKRMDLVIDAVHELRSRGFDVTLSIIGEGEERPSLEQQVIVKGLAGKIDFTGRVGISEMPVVMSKGHVLVSASEFETFGVTLIEGLALGMPVVATCSGGPENIVTPDVGKLVKSWDAYAIADAIEAIMRDIDQFEPQKMRQYCEQHYSGPVISAALRTIYSKVVGYVEH